MNKLVASILTAVLAVAFCSRLQASQVAWGAQETNGVGSAGIGMANGTALANGSGDVALLGSFNISNSLIIANGNNYAYLMAHFTQFDSAAIGQGNPNGMGSASDGYWTGNANASANALSLQNKEIYYWVFDSPNPSTATEYGIFTSSSLSSWVFPDDNANPDTTTTDLSQVAHDSTGILFGSYGSGMSADGMSPLYNLGIVSAPVPEPSTWVAGILCFGTLLSGAIRRRTKH